MHESRFEPLLYLGTAGVLVLGLLLMSEAEAAPTPARTQELVHLVRQDCGSCHGMRLSGGLGPALTPDRLATRPREAMLSTILHGRPGTPMPPWAPFLSEDEAGWIVDHLFAGFPGEGADAR